MKCSEKKPKVLKDPDCTKEIMVEVNDRQVDIASLMSKDPVVTIGKIAQKMQNAPRIILGDISFVKDKDAYC